MKKKQVAFVVNGLYGGGAEKVLQIFLANFDRKKYEITLINHRGDELLEAYYPTDIKYKRIRKNYEKKKSRIALFFAKAYNKINLIIYENFSPRIFRLIYLRDKFDVEIAFIEGYATRIVSGGDSEKKIAWVHSDLKSCLWTEIAFRPGEEQSECYSLFDEIVCVSENVKKSVRELFFCDSIVINNPIDAKEILATSSQFVVKRKDDTVLFVTVGRLVPAKGYDRLIPIIGQLVSEGFDFRLWILGDGFEKERLENLIKEWKLEEVVTLWGHQSNPYPYIKAGDIFICSSRSEGYSTAVTEALILGLPLITTLCAGMKELLENGKYGIIVENEDSALLEGMRNVLQDRAIVDKYAERAREGCNRFSLEKQMSEIYSVIDN